VDTAFEILAALSFCHLLNDMMQSLIPAIYPILKQNFQLDFTQVGLITFVLQLTGALLQPVVGFYSDRHPKPYALATGMGFTLLGMLLLSRAGSFAMVLAATSFVGLGSSIFHPESSRMARAASGGRHGFAQSFFQVGGNFGSALGPLLAAFIVLRNGQTSIAWFSIAALVAMLFLFRVGGWYKHSGAMHAAKRAHATRHDAVSQRQVMSAVMILLALLFSKFVYLASLGSYYTFYLISRFGLSVQSAQIHLFVFLGSVVLSDRCLCAGVDAGTSRNDRGAVLRCGVRHQRHRRCRARSAGRQDRHLLRLSSLFVPTGDWRARVLAAARRSPDAPARAGQRGGA
jgi:FSR family fosmidomycin resistance protein-like MFS transporter